jgi:hypothetical protein
MVLRTLRPFTLAEICREVRRAEAVLVVRRIGPLGVRRHGRLRAFVSDRPRGVDPFVVVFGGLGMLPRTA